MVYNLFVVQVVNPVHGQDSRRCLKLFRRFFFRRDGAKEVPGQFFAVAPDRQEGFLGFLVMEDSALAATSEPKHFEGACRVLGLPSLAPRPFLEFVQSRKRDEMAITHRT